MWETFRQVKTNIPLLDAIKQVPTYAKYLKDLCTKKWNRKIPKQINLTDNVSTILSGALPPKLQDPGTPIISIQVGDFKMTRALLDLRASISILPGSLYDQYDFGPLRAVATTVVLANQTPKLPRGMLHDVIVKVEDIYFPVDFLVLDYVSGERTKQPTVILCRPFMATTNAKIDCRTGIVDLAFGNHKLRLNVFTHVNNSPVADECFMADIIDECIPLYDSVVDTDGTAETCFMFDRLQVETDNQLEEEEKKLEVAALRGDRPPWSVQVEPLPEKIDTGLKPSLQEAPKVELKELPRHLKYAFLGKNDTLPIIIASNLSLEQESALLKVLVANKEAIGGTIADLKGISPSIVMHKILTHSDVKPAHDAQRRLNPNMWEVVKKEVLKWLDAGIIFSISDSTWVSPTQTVPKKDWSTKLTDALWVYRTAFKTPIGTTPYRLVYGKDCHLLVEIAQRAYWATKEVNTSYDDACKARKLELCEIEELWDEAYECASAYKAKMKKVHDAKIRLKSFKIGQKVWLYNTRMKLFPGKLKSKWTGPFVIVGVGNHEQFEMEDLDDHIRQVVNGYRLKPYLEMDDIHKMDKESVRFIVTSPVYEDN
ncbi:uncharacterized protein LOC143621975 [Bidens hawaiensis]|uniref:uncharacterized protein LOC143621975 n=1 Tax=Bidens hawaiensis TaxID=980011 RepID=UPI00404A2B46